MKVLVLCAVLSLGLSVATYAGTRDLSFEERVAAQKAIEQVYWNHRIWPKENPGAKPRLAAVIPDATIRAKVQDYLRTSALLDSFWHQPLTGEQLQAEVNRMVRNTKAPETLRELFVALTHDPLLVAECLARPALAKRRVEAAFAHDERIHGAQRVALMSKLEGVDDLAKLESLDGDHSDLMLFLDQGVAGSPPEERVDQGVPLTRDEWNRELEGLAANFDVSPVDGLSAIPVGRVSPLVDHGDRFVAFAVRAKSATSVTIASVSWAKRTYGEWAREMAASSTLDPSVIAQPALGYSMMAPVLGGCTDDTWTPTAGSTLPTARSGHTAVWTGTEMIVWGGEGGTFRNSEKTGGRYNPAIDSWTESSLTNGSGANVPGARWGHTAVWTGTEMIVWGGHYDDGIVINTGGLYNPSTDLWVPSSLTTGSGANVPNARGNYTAVWTGTEMIVWGGYGGGFLNTGGCYDPLTDTWAATSLTDGSGANVPDARYGHTAVWTGTEMIVWGGVGAGPYSYFNTGGRYNPAMDTWAASSLTDGSGANVPTARSGHTAVWTGSEMIVWGGALYDPLFRDLNTGGRYDPSTDTWAGSSLTTGSGLHVPGPRAVHSAVWTGAEMIVWGGIGEADFNSGGRYDPSTDSWVESSLTNGTGANVPEARGGHTAVWTGSEMIVWGGSYRDTVSHQSALLNTGGRYDPATDSWTWSSLTFGANGPGARALHTAVWTGSEMIVWGGSVVVIGGPLLLNTGGRYDPATDTWVASSLTTGSGANVPSAREAPTAVWTGTEMIVWGGTHTATGGRYNPGTDLWAASSLNTGSGMNVPEARYQHTAVWTGSEMMVWGGRHDDAPPPSPPRYLNDGGRYNPATDRWAPMSLTNVPSRGDGHTAVWSGTEMIVWGGSNGSAALSSGGRYNPSTDSWIASSLTTGAGANVPSARPRRTAVWSGSEMIVWGGGTQFSTEKTGGRYNPFTDSWATSSLTVGSGENVPPARYLHTAVWTGPSDRRMIVWGGYPHTRLGGLYCAVCTTLTWYQDLDGDGHGNPNVTTLSSCTPPGGYVVAGDDCNDANPAIHAGASEVCNDIDDNCDTVIDNGGNAVCNDTNPCTTDACNGAAGCSHVNNTAACNDANACTTNDACNGLGACVGALDCDDSSACTADACIPAVGCIRATADWDTTGFSVARVDGRDLVVLAAAWNSCPWDPIPVRYNVAANLDPLTACIDGTDFHLFMTTFGHNCP